ncbi:MAG: hypothetical protein E7331_11665 [Clostridiales bacterium]|nr:hypothetical protein [Clostridiales bacterium]
MKGEYMWNSGVALDEMRLIVEGAVVLFEEDALPLNQLAKKHQEWLAANAFSTIGAALYSLRQHIRELHEAHVQEVVRQIAEDDEA